MTQLSANTGLFDQIAKKIAKFSSDYLSGKFRTKDEMTEQYNEVVRSLSIDFQKPLTKVNSFIKGEPPVSGKINEFSSSLADDINILSRQVDNLSAKTISNFNLFSQEIENEKKHQERIASKIKILEMYSKSIANDIYYYGDSFENSDYVNFSKIKTNLNPSINNGKLTLLLSSKRRWAANSIAILESEGFTGDNHKVVRSINSEGSGIYRYSFETIDISSRTASLTDANPATYFEIESINVDKSDIGNGVPLDREFLYYVDRPTIDAKPNNTYVSWNQSLNKLGLKVSFTKQSPEKINSVNITPFFGSSNILKVSQVLVFNTEGQSTNVISEPIYIGKNIVSYDISTSKNYYHNKATIRFPEVNSNRVDIVFEQENVENVTVQHIYWATNYQGDNTESSPFFGQRRFSPEAISLDDYNEVQYDRLAIIPKITNKNQFKNGDIYKNVTVFLEKKDSNLTKERFVVPIKTQKEIRNGTRLSIGIRDIELGYETYSNSSQIISSPFLLDYPLESVMLDVDYISNGGSIRSYVSVDNGVKWIEISNIQSGFMGVPEVLAFNKFISNDYKLPGVGYVNYPDVPEQINSVLVKIDLFGNQNVNTTPEVYSYTLIAKVRK